MSFSITIIDSEGNKHSVECDNFVLATHTNANPTNIQICHISKKNMQVSTMLAIANLINGSEQNGETGQTQETNSQTESSTPGSDG